MGAAAEDILLPMEAVLKSAQMPTSMADACCVKTERRSKAPALLGSALAKEAMM